MVNKRQIRNEFIIFQQQTTVQMWNVSLDGDVLHYILGLASTLYKIKQLYTTNKYRKQYVDEVGQFYWYLAGLCWKLAVVFNPCVPSPKTGATPFYDWARVEDRVMTIADYYRQYLAEKKEFPTGAVEILIYEILEYLVNILWALEIEVEECLQVNMDKLAANKNENSEAIENTVLKELAQIKRAIGSYRKRGRPTKVERRETEALTIGETWNDKENYAARRKRRPGVRKHKGAWRKTLEKYKQQKRNRLKT